MQSAVLFVMASIFSVTYGWQPMPDGSESYEYVVQLDHELLARLERGESIPISTDIPEDIQPIRRIRLVVGNEDLPRQKLVTALKPEQSDKGGDVVRGQYTEPAPRYPSNPILPADSQPRQILPADSQARNSVNALGDALQRTAQETRDAGGVQILPRSNPVSSGRGGDILPPDRTARISNTSENTTTTDDAAIRELFAEPSGSGIGADSSSDPPPILPRNNSLRNGNNSNNRLATGQPNDTSGPRYPDYRETANAGTISPPPRNNQSEPASPGIKAPWPEDERFENSPLAQEYNSRNGDYRNANAGNNLGTQNPTAKSNAYDFANDSRQDNNSQNAGFASRNPSEGNNAGGQVPEIRRHMLDQPVDEGFRMASDTRAERQSFFSESTEDRANSTQFDINPPDNQSNDQPPANTNSNFAEKPPINDPTTLQQNGNSSGVQMFPLVLAWVLLSGSGAGNLYLVWSYLDIRSKYRGLVRSAGRKLGRRYLDDRYGDPDDDYDD